MPIFNGEPSGRAPVSGAFTATGQSASFEPVSCRAFNVSLDGTFVGAVQLERQFSGETAWRLITVTAGGSTSTFFQFTAPVSETIEEPEAGVSYRLNCTAFTSGTINYRISQ